MKYVILILLILLLLVGCRNNKEALTIKEQVKLLHIAIKVEEDSSWAMIKSAIHGSHYLVKQHFLDSIYLDTGVINLIDKKLNLKGFQRRYKEELKESNKLISDSFVFVRINEFTNKTPEFLSFSKPIRYQKYYLMNFSYNSWSSGYSTILILEKKTSNNFNIVYRRVYRIS